jgi:hypothetical protein
MLYVVLTPSWALLGWTLSQSFRVFNDLDSSGDYWSGNLLDSPSLEFTLFHDQTKGASINMTDLENTQKYNNKANIT